MTWRESLLFLRKEPLLLCRKELLLLPGREFYEAGRKDG
jgi:hypothetical protein